jgi:thioredoxin reductase
MSLFRLGGGPAGFSAALTLSRTLRKVVLFDSGVYRNANVKYMHNVSNFDGTSPTDYRNGMREELRKR